MTADSALLLASPVVALVLHEYVQSPENSCNAHCPYSEVEMERTGQCLLCDAICRVRSNILFRLQHSLFW